MFQKLDLHEIFKTDNNTYFSFTPFISFLYDHFVSLINLQNVDIYCFIQRFLLSTAFISFEKVCNVLLQRNFREVTFNEI